MGADVMLGHDPDCARWIKRFRDTPSTGAGVAAVVGGAAEALRAAAKAAIAGVRRSGRCLASRDPR
jgi:hypothetical protein